MARRKKHEDHASHEAWAIPYGDLVTLLLAFFVVMYAISSVNAGKYHVLSDSLITAFRGGPQAATVAPTDARVAIVQPLPGDAPRKLAQATASRLVPPIVSGAPAADGHAPESAESFQKVGDALEEAMKDLIASRTVILRRHDRSVEVELRTDILFPSGAADIAPAAQPAIEKLAVALRRFENPIQVEGHTDNRPISTTLYPSNWELSAARAATVVHLLARGGVDPLRLSVLGLGDQHPAASNDTPEGRNANRRVLLVVQRIGDAPAGDRGPAPLATPVAPAAPAAAMASAH